MCPGVCNIVVLVLQAEKKRKVMNRKMKAKYVLGVLAAGVILGSLCGCGSGNTGQVTEIESLQEDITSDKIPEETEETDHETVEESNTEADVSQTASDTAEENDLDQAQEESHLDQIEPDPADDNWYMKGSVYKSDNGHYLEIFFNDEGMLEFAVDGLSQYYSYVDRVQFENNWRIYDCDDGVMIVYYPGDPAHIEIYDGDLTELYEENENTMND